MLRVPLLYVQLELAANDPLICLMGRYGEVEFNSETAVNIFVDVIEDQSGKTYKSTCPLLTIAHITLTLS